MESINAPEQWFPLRVLVCERCWLVQTEDFTRAEELFDSEYAYFSGISRGWTEHCRQYVREVVERFGLTRESHVIEVAANDGSLLQFMKERDIPCTGIEPTASTAAAARDKGVPIVESFFDEALAQRLVNEARSADLIIANNVLAHVPDINDFVAGAARLLKPDGVATFEFPHLLRLLEEVQFDTIYHEHYSYLSMMTVRTVFDANGLQVFDVEEIPTHGGSLRVFAQRADVQGQYIGESVERLVDRERRAGLDSMPGYVDFQQKAERVKDELLEFLLARKRDGEVPLAYGAAAKGNTLLNFAGIRGDLVKAVVDRNPSKQGKYMPGSRIPIVDETELVNAPPAYVLILPWNIRDEVMTQLSWMRERGTRFVTAVPELRVW